ncbi:MAG: phosphatidylserine decarboxylase [Nakamurella sp.]
MSKPPTQANAAGVSDASTGERTAGPSAPSTLGHVFGLVRSAIPRIHPGGRVVIAGVWGATWLVRMALRAMGLRRLSRVAGRVSWLATAGSALFFRMPTRVPPADDAAVVAPADGIVSLITEAVPPAETGLGAAPRTRVSIFLSVLDVHVQYAPVSGRVAAAHYHPGAFLSADLDKASEVNERNSLTITPHVGGDTLVVTQIAGLIARRIVCDVGPGDNLAAGQVYGLIRFGSRLDVYLPAGAVPLVHLGQRAVGGETVLAHLPARFPDQIPGPASGSAT